MSRFLCEFNFQQILGRHLFKKYVCVPNVSMYEEDYLRSYGSVLDFVFYIVAYRYRRYGKEIVNYYEVCHKL